MVSVAYKSATVREVYCIFFMQLGVLLGSVGILDV